MRNIITLIIIIIAYSNPLIGQEEKKESNFFTGISPVILEKEKAEIVCNNTLTSFWLTSSQYLPAVDAYRVVDRQRYARLDQMVRVTYGFSKNKRWDLATELRFAHTRLDESARSSPLRVLGNATATGNSVHEFAAIGLRARASLFKKIPELTLQATVSYPMSRVIVDRERWLDPLQTQAGLGATYFVQSSENTFYFFQADWTTRFGSQQLGQTPTRTTNLTSASTYIVIRVWEDNWYIFPSLSYGLSSRFYNSKFSRINQQLLGGLGVFFQPSPRFSVLLNGNLPLIFSSGSTLTAFDKSTYTGVTLGLRTLFN